MSTKLLNSKEAGFEADFKALVAAKRQAGADVGAEVRAILGEIRANGDQALIDMTRRFDGFELTPETICVTAQELDRAATDCTVPALESLTYAASRITDFHYRQLPAPLDYQDKAGVRLGISWKPISAVGIYVPGGTAAYPSSVLMNAIPAKVAGVKRLVMAVPAPGGQIPPLVLAAASMAGVDEVYRVGGAQAIGALAYGTRTIAPVDKIVGPGNAYVAEAKRQVFGTVGIDMIAGPSEILIVADGANEPKWIAADLMSQAEHDVSAQAIMITDDDDFAGAVSSQVEVILETLPRAKMARQSWEDHGCIITVAGLDEAPALIDRVAPEHLELAVADPDALAAKVSNAGAIFLGRFTPEAIGDYVAGPHHVLPTAGSARFSSGLGVLDFMKRTTFVGCDEASLKEVGPPAIALAEAEGLAAHALSVNLRLKADNKD
ncbi:MAG: histidinol dehydrogenase [Rhodospirillales bacterium]